MAGRYANSIGRPRPEAKRFPSREVRLRNCSAKSYHIDPKTAGNQVSSMGNDSISPDTTTAGPDRGPLSAEAPSKGTVGEVFVAFLKLGLTSFGGPIAHLGYYRDELVVRRKWLDETTFADLVALCQFLPGPASSQVGFSLGVLRGNGLLGGLAAWLAFTLPSAIIMFGFASVAGRFTGPLAQGFLHGLKLVAVAVVAQAIWGMTRSLTPDKPRAAIALAALAVVVLFPGSFAQVSAIVLGALAGLWLCRAEAAAISGGLNFP